MDPSNTSAAPFEFRQRDKGINWRVLDATDPDRIARTGDVRGLLACLDDVSFADLQRDELVQGRPEAFKAFKLAQYSIQYLLHSQRILASHNAELDRFKQWESNRLAQLQDKAKQQAAKIKAYKRQIQKCEEATHQYETLMAYMQPDLLEVVTKQKEADEKQRQEEREFKRRIASEKYREQGGVDRDDGNDSHRLLFRDDLYKEDIARRNRDKKRPTGTKNTESNVQDPSTICAPQSHAITSPKESNATEIAAPKLLSAIRKKGEVEIGIEKQENSTTPLLVLPSGRNQTEPPLVVPKATRPASPSSLPRSAVKRTSAISTSVVQSASTAKAGVSTVSTLAVSSSSAVHGVVNSAPIATSPDESKIKPTSRFDSIPHDYYDDFEEDEADDEVLEELDADDFIQSESPHAAGASKTARTRRRGSRPDVSTRKSSSVLSDTISSIESPSNAGKENKQGSHADSQGRSLGRAKSSDMYEDDFEDALEQTIGLSPFSSFDVSASGSMFDLLPLGEKSKTTQSTGSPSTPTATTPS